MAINLSTKINITIQDDDETILDVNIKSRTLNKKDRKEITKLIKEAQDKIEDDSIAALDDIEVAAKVRFEMQITGDPKDVKSLAEVAEEYGYTTIIQEIDERVQEAKQGK